MEAFVRNYKLRTGAVKPMSNDRIPKKVLFGELAKTKM